MKTLLSSIQFLLILALLIVAFSIYADKGCSSWIWFQRSGSILVIVGALFTYRSIVRLGIQGVGSLNISILKGRIESTTDYPGTTQKVNISFDEKTHKSIHEDRMDKLAGYIGVFFMLTGTLIWGYGDLLGSLM